MDDGDDGDREDPPSPVRKGGFARGDKLARARRMRRIEELLATDLHVPAICEVICQEFDVVERTVRNDITAVEKTWVEAEWVSPQKMRNRRRRVLEALYRRCLAAEDLKAAVAVQDKLAKIDGLYEQKHTITVRYTDEELDRALSELVADQIRALGRQQVDLILSAGSEVVEVDGEPAN